MSPPRSVLHYAASELDADILYPTRFFAPDPFLFVQKGRRRILVMSDLEIDRARKQATVDRVLAWSRYQKALEAAGRKASPAAVIEAVLRELGLRRIEVPSRFPLGLAEELRAAVNTRIMAEGCVPAHTICAPGDQAVDPHEEGHGPIRAHSPVVMDIFPRSERSGYFGDLTRTVVRGRAPERLREVYALVHEGVRLGHRRVRPGADGMAIHREIQELFESRGYATGVRDGRIQGFFHGTGHGLGLEIHEAPSIGKRPSTLRAGHVVTVEPGLYYLGLGGVRIEDVALVTATGSRNLTRAAKVLEV